MIFGRISRFNRILLLDEAGESSVISNDLTSPWKLERLRGNSVSGTERENSGNTGRNVFSIFYGYGSCQKFYYGGYI